MTQPGAVSSFVNQLGHQGQAGAQAQPAAQTPSAAQPQAAGEDMVVVPAGWFGNLLSQFAGTIGGGVGGLFGNAQAGSAIGQGLSPVLKMIPFSTVPGEAVPAAGQPAQQSFVGPWRPPGGFWNNPFRPPVQSPPIIARPYPYPFPFPWYSPVPAGAVA